MSDGLIFILIFSGLLVLRIVAATIVFLYLLPAGDRCPLCDDVTLRVRSRGWNLLLPWFRTSWCPGCGWDGLLRHGPLTSREPTALTPAGQARDSG